MKLCVLKGKAGWLVPHRGDECSNQVTSCVCPPVRMKETDDPDQDCGFLDNLPQKLEDLRAGWGQHFPQHSLRSQG